MMMMMMTAVALHPLPLPPRPLLLLLLQCSRQKTMMALMMEREAEEMVVGHGGSEWVQRSEKTTSQHRCRWG